MKNKLPDVLKQKKLSTGLSFVDMAKILGVEARTFNHYSSGARIPNIIFLYKLFHKLDIEPNEFFEYVSKKEPVINQNHYIQAFLLVEEILKKENKNITMVAKAKVILHIYEIINSSPEIVKSESLNKDIAKIISDFSR